MQSLLFTYFMAAKFTCFMAILRVVPVGSRLLDEFPNFFRDEFQVFGYVLNIFKGSHM